MGTQNKGIAKIIIIGQTAFLYALWLHWTKGGNGGRFEYVSICVLCLYMEKN